MHTQLSNNNHQNPLYSGRNHDANAGLKSISNANSVEHGNAYAFESDAGRHSRNIHPENKPDLFSVTQNIESRPVNVINHAALYELTS